MTKKENIILLCLITIIVLIILIISFFPFIRKYINYLNNKNNFENSISVVTEDENSQKKQYYEINEYKNRKKLKNSFIYDNEIYNLENCYFSYINNNKVLNKLNEEKCNSLKTYSDDENIINIIYKISNLEHDIISAKILKTNNNYYIVVSLNVNMWSPYALYLYDKNLNTLILLYTFDGEDIIGINDESFKK